MGWLPRIRAGRVIAYFLRALLICIVLGLGAAVLILAVNWIVPADAGALRIVLLLLAATVLIGPVYWRLMASLPGAALDEGARIGTVWAATKGQTVTLLLLMVIVWGAVVLAGIVIAVIGMMLPDAGILIMLLENVLLNWFTTMFTLSLLTTLYGYYVEGRDLI
ncbi:hypothetical protein [Paenirhodobacter sp.]|uniref:hypothetical protein n=1 Tax=Paenirhodobacter sp. TaxID=1965326 RepID=UPI003B41AFFA